MPHRDFRNLAGDAFNSFNPHSLIPRDHRSGRTTTLDLARRPMNERFEGVAIEVEGERIELRGPIEVLVGTCPRHTRGLGR